MKMSDVKFLCKKDRLETIKGGYSGAFLYKISRENKNYFLKIFNYTLTKNSINRIKKGLEVYKKLNIKSLELIDHGPVKNSNQYYIVYNYIDGVDLKKYGDQISLDEINKIGVYFGKQFLKLKKYQGKENAFFPIVNLDKVTKDAIENFNLLLKEKKSKDKLMQYFSMKDIIMLKEKLIEYLEITKKAKKGIIHGDIKRANVILDNNHNLYVVDCESIQIAPDIMNFRFQITWALFSKPDKIFISGFLDGLYNNKRPGSFNQMALYCIILNFMQATYNKYTREGIEKMEEYIINIKDLFNKLKKMDLKTESII